ncbi:hypothetical protein JCM6882_008715 [Rhodosporidiobolus microsporus]
MEPESAALLEEPMKLRERRVGQGFWVASSSDSDDDRDAGGSVSDGDPPYLAGGASSAAVGHSASTAPSYAGSDSGSVAGGAAGGRKAAGGAGGGGGGGSRRTFEELEDIIFSNPRSFVTLAGAIADARGVQLVISDDRTHKVSSAYMHVTCSFKKAGCPLILKLTKAKEGGWIIKGTKPVDKHSMDVKQRSCYRCRHSSGSKPDTNHGVTVPDWLSKSHSYPEPGTKPKAAKSRTASVGGGDSMYSPEGAFPAQMESLAGKAATTRGLGVASRMFKTEGGGLVNPSPMADGDRALAPPFQRSLDLQAQISPALPVKPLNGASPGGGIHGSPQEMGRPGYYHSTSAPAYPHGAGSPPVPQQGRHRASYSNGSGVPYGSPYDLTAPHASYPPSAASTPRYPYPSSGLPPPAHAFPPHPQQTLPVVCTSSPSALPEWTLLLSAIGDASLLPLAKVLASPAVSCTPSEYFTPGVDPKLREAFLNELPEKAMGLWPKLKFAKAMRERGEQAWKEVVEQRERDGERGFVSGVRRNTLPKDIPMQGAVLGNGAGSHSPSPGASVGAAISAAAAASAMDVDPSPSTRPGEESSNPPPPPGAAAENAAEEGGVNGA